VKSNVAVYTGLALFAGAGGLELGLKLALGEHYRTVAYVEREASSAAVLATNMERPESGLDKGVIWDDVTSFTGDVISPFVDRIDIMSAGFPCQPWSVAGARKGTEDERWLWPHIFRLVREIRPRNIFLENVTGLLHGGIEHVLGDLASVGFDAEWISVRAADVGAPHRRERVFILAHTGHDARRSEQEQQHTLETAGVGQSSTALGNANIQRQRAQGDSELTPAGIGGGCRPFPWPPGPGSIEDWREVIEVRPDLAPAVKPEVRGMDDGVARGLARTQQLRILGNGVVPQQAALAFQILKERIDA
jgi:DNA (cytosine-5)-methyltransferase 1